MEPTKRVGNFLIFKEKREDILGKEFRAGWIENEKIKNVISLVAIKEVLTKNDEILKKFSEGMREIANLIDPKVVRTLGFGAIGENVFLSREYIRGETIGDILTTSISEKNFMPLDIALFLFSQIASTLEYVQAFKLEGQRMFHGFLNPSDILVTYDGIPKIKNFMVYPILENYPYERTNITKLYERYLTPDHKSGLPVTFSTDIYSFGMLLFEFLTGTPFEFKQGENLKEKLDNAKLLFPYKDSTGLPLSLKNFLLKALSPNPEDRFSSIREMRRNFDAIISEENMDASTFNLAFYMNSLFGIVAEKEDKEIESEVSAEVIPVEVKEEVTVERKEAPVRYPAIEFTAFKVKERRSPIPIFIVSIVLVAVLAVVGTLLIVGKKQPQPQAPTISEAEIQKAIDQRIAELQQKMKEDFEARYKAKEEEIKKAYDELMKKANEQQKKVYEEQMKKALDDLEKKKEADRAQQQEQLRAEAEKLAKETKEKETPPAEKKQTTPEKVETPAETKAQEVPPAQPAVEKPATPYAPIIAPPKEGEVVAYRDLSKKPEFVKKGIPNPDYPEVAKRFGVKGSVLVQVLISEKGDVIDVKVLQENPKGKGFAQSVIKAVKTWKFTPPEKDGVKVKTWVTLPVFKFQ
jgi:TonB family protein